MAVVGAGLGGLLVAAMLARKGARVVVLERGSDVGGRLRSREIDGFVVDDGAYLWPDVYLSKALELAGATSFVSSRIPAAQVLRLFAEGEGGRRLSFPYPDRRPARAYLDDVETVLGLDARGYERLCQLWQRLAVLSNEEVEGLRHVAVRDALPRFTGDADVMSGFCRNAMLFGTYDPDNASMAECIGLARIDPQAPRPLATAAGANSCGGVRALPRAICAAAKAAGAEVRLAREVIGLRRDGRRVAGVEVREPGGVGRLAAANVVLNAPLWQVFDWLDTTVLPAKLVEQARSWSVVGGVIAAAYAFRALPRLRETGEEDTFAGWTRLLIGATRAFGGGALWASQHSPANAPAGCHVLQVMRLSPQRDVRDANRCAEVHSAFDRILREIYADFAEKVLWSDRWATTDGSEYMISPQVRPPVALPGLDGLYCVGETTDVPAIQMDAAALSATRCAQMLGA